MKPEQKEFLKKYKNDKSLILVGDVGVGKTHIMNYLEKKILDGRMRNEAGIDCYWIDDGEFREKITSGIMKLKSHEVYGGASIISYPLEMMTRAKVLFFDDLGASENISEAQKTKFKYVLDEREKRKLPTIFSTNLSVLDIENLYGERIKSRVFLNSVVLTMQGEDKRKQNTIFI